MSKTITRTKIRQLLEIVQEFVNTNPNEVGTLADSALLTEAIYAELGQHDEAPVNSGAHA
jgi:hypothetical protein